MNKIAFLALPLAATLSVSAVAESDKYVTASTMLTSYDVDGLDSAVGFGVAVGAKVKSNSAKVNTYVEGGFAYLGEASDETTSGIVNLEVDVSAATLFGQAKSVYSFTDKAGVFAKLGLNYISVESEVSGSAGDFSVTGNGDESELKLLYGVGAEYRLNQKVKLSADYTAFASDISALQFNASMSF